MTETIQKKILERLGLILRTGQMETGQERCVELIRSGEAAIAFLDESASENTQKRLVNACKAHQVPLYELEKGMLGHSIGKPGRSVVSIRHGGLSEKLRIMLQNETRLDAVNPMDADNCGGVIRT